MNKKYVRNAILVAVGFAVLFVLFDFAKDFSKEKEVREKASQEEVVRDNNDDEKKTEEPKDFDVSDESEFEDIEEEPPADEDELMYGAFPGQIAYDFELEVIGGEDGEMVRLSDFQGKKVFLNFWASWCPPCRIEAPELQRFSENQDEVVVLGVNVTSSESSMENILGFFDEFETTFTNVYGIDDLFSLYFVESLPTSLFIDSEGIIQERVTGPVTEDSLNAHFSMFD